MSWWPLRSLKIVKVSEGGSERGREERGERKRIIVSSLPLSQKMRRSRRRPFGSWRCFGPWSRTTSSSWRRLFAEGGSSTLYLNMLRGSVQLRCHYPILSSCFSLLQHLGSKFQHAEAARLSIKKHHHGNIWTMLLVNNGIPHCVARVSSQVFISWQVLFSYCTPVMLASCPPLLPSESYIYDNYNHRWI